VRRFAFAATAARSSRSAGVQRHRLLLGVLACIACVSCAVRDYTPRPLPTFLDESGDGGEPEQAAVAASEERGPDADRPSRVTLAEAVAECLAADPRIRAGAELVQQAQSDLWTASLVPNPTLGTSGSLLPLDRPFTVTRQGGPPQFDVGLAFPIDWLLFGKRAAAITSARTGVDVAAAEYADLVRQRLAATVAAFYDVLEAEALLALAREDLESFERLQHITEELVRLGGAGTIEIDRVRVLVLDSQRDVRQRTAAVAVAKAALLAQLGRSTSAADFDVDGQLNVAAAATPLSAERAFSIAERYRPDLVAADLRVAKAEADYRAEQRNAFPDVAPRAGYTRQFQEKAIGFPDANSFGVGVDLSLPIFDRNQGNIAKASSVVAQSRNEKRARLVDLRSEVEQATREFQFAAEAVSTEVPVRLQAARNTRDKMETAYRAGGRPLIDVLDAQRTLRDTQRLAIQDRAAYWKGLYHVNATVGKEVLR
jgi:cobalt-zinc-cadmium efflux system outer membrane protein